MSYRVVITATAVKERRLDTKIQDRIDSTLRSLREEPRPRGAKKLTGSEQDWRIRMGNYRISYDIYCELEQVSPVKKLR